MIFDLEGMLTENLPPPEQERHETEIEYQQKLGLLHEQKAAFQQAYGSPAGQQVLRMMKKFCYANESCVILGDRDRTLVLEGRREVWLLIQDYLDLTIEQLAEKLREVHGWPAKKER